MPHYHHIRDPETGLTHMRLVEQTAPAAEDIPSPSKPEAEGSELQTLFKCQLCPEDRWPIVMLAAKHFHNEHEDLDEDKDSWREYITEVPA